MNTLQDAISFGETEQCKALISLDPSCVNTTGWHGLTPLHGAATKGKLEVVKLLIENGANVNAVNTFAASPILFACQAGNLLVVHELIESGASLKVKDNACRGCVHYAARSGCVKTMHYLHSVGKADLGQHDARGQTALHIATEHGHTELIRYFLKFMRVDPLAQDENQATAMHISATKGNCETCWLLESLSAETLLETKDIHGRTPIDEAEGHHTPRHSWLVRHMNYWKIRRQKTGKPPSYPLLTWLFIALCPFFGIIAIIQALERFPAVVGVIVSLVIVIVTFLWAVRRHRLRHVSQTQSPGYAGLFYGFIIHSLFCYYYYILPRIGPDFFFTIFGIFLIPLSLYVINLVYGDPGKATAVSRKNKGWPVTILDVAKQNIPLKDFCSRCEIVIPEWGKHCRLCNQCMIGLDHHCLYLMTCVARYNHRYFLYLVCLVVMAQILYIRAAVIFILLQAYSSSSRTVMNVITDELWVTVLMLVNIFGGLWTTGLFLSQLKMISEQETTCFLRHGELRKSYNDLQKSTSYDSVHWKRRLRNIRDFFLDSETYYTNIENPSREKLSIEEF